MPPAPDASPPPPSSPAAAVVSIVVPAWREVANLPHLLPRIDAALAGRAYEVIIVDDDSRDGTVEACAALARTYPVRLLVRDHPTHGLSGAVLHGIAAATGDTLAVMDADLQHPPERLPDLLAPVESAEPDAADFALGSRYVPGGSTDGEWTLFRRINSWVATALARPFAGSVRDPMSGFFALRRSTYARADRLTPLGYKIALELMCKCRVRRVQEVPIHFALRTAGESKLSLQQQFRYLEHLSRLYDFTFPRASPMAKFAIATVIGFAVGVAGFLVADRAGVGLTTATAVGYALSLAVTAVFHARYVRTQRAFLVTPRPWLDFVVISAVELLAAVTAAAWLGRHVVDVPDLERFALAFAVGLAVRYVLRKELLQDVRGLRHDVRAAEIAPAARA